MARLKANKKANKLARLPANECERTMVSPERQVFKGLW
jgi:hypothetical protein